MKKLTRRGFTLPEILVTVTVIAVLAAVVVPTVLQYVSKGDAPSVLSEIDAIKKGVIGFTADTRHYPRTMQQLTTSISSTDSCSAAASCALDSVAYRGTELPSWKGPYFESTVLDTSSTYTTKALGLVFNTTLVHCGAGGKFICLKVPTSTYTAAQIAALDKAIDGGDGVAASATTDANAENGNLIWTVSGTPFGPTAGTIFYKLGVAN